MKPQEMDSLDTVEFVMMIEEVFGTDIPDSDAESFCSPREIVDKLEQRFSNSRPNEAAKALLKKLAKDQARPELAEGLDGTWRREQIAAIVREFFRDVD
jgi:hypothetical protein